MFTDKHVSISNLVQALILGVICYIIGLFSARIGFIKFDDSVNIIDLIQVIITLLLGLLLPILVTKMMDDSKGIKCLIIDEIKNFLEEAKKIRLFLNEINTKGEVTGTDKDKIRALIYNAELLITSVNEQIQIAFKDEKLQKKLSDSFIKYEDDVAGGELMSSEFKKINFAYLNLTNTSHSNFETEVKKILQEVYKM